LAAEAAVVLLAIVFVTLRTKDGKKTDVAGNVPAVVASAKSRVQKEKKNKAGPDRGRPFRTGLDRLLVFAGSGNQTRRPREGELEIDWASPGPEHAGYSAAANVTDVEILLDGKTRASTYLGGMVRMWDLGENGFREKRPIRQQTTHAFLGHCLLVIAPDRRHFVTRSEECFQAWRVQGVSCQRLNCDDAMGQIYVLVEFVTPTQFTTNGNGSQQL